MDQNDHKQIIDNARAGSSGLLKFKFESDDPFARIKQINDRIAGADLKGVITTVLISKADQEAGLPIPTPPGHFAHSRVGADVPGGWFHIAVSKGTEAKDCPKCGAPGIHPYASSNSEMVEVKKGEPRKLGRGDTDLYSCSKCNHEWSAPR
jgi:hypothetical protein